MYLSPKQTRIVELLAQGLKPTQVASYVGVTPAYIAQLAKNEEFKKELAARIDTSTGEAGEAAERLDIKYDALEHTLVEKIQEASQFAEGTVLVKMLDSVARRQAMRKGQLRPQIQNTQIVSITLPAHIAPAPLNTQINEQNQITAIGNRLLAPMSAEGVRNRFAQMSTRTAPEQTPTAQEHPAQSAALVLDSTSLEDL